MKAVIWRDETLGAEFDVVEIPADLRRKGQALSRADDRSGLGIRRHAVREVRRRRAADRRRNQRRHPQGDHRAEDLPGDLRHRVQEQGRPDHARRRGRLPALAARYSAGARDGSSIDHDVKADPQAARQRAVFRAGLQDHDRPVFGSARVLPRLFGQDERRRIDLQRGQGPQRARGPPVAHARQQARRDPGNPGGRYLRRRRSEDRLDRRHDLRRRRADRRSNRSTSRRR